ncbi:gamma-glutamyltransferase [Flavobacterium sp. HSC-61S13]|uniref:gamma-glutamyltransferase n=1 Tax=Flavobacterium sp. HSC-61S13 TaxID=2910963 RepID=UPI0020A14128|nr:gamma-glutamyltransferase [Flavobacterium sp. HSC-61S13]MCP1994294.1 gamma-glutamyltranspeptidase/glutathione hydrolase [Flavobacterium sp. HSC-61S13]
MKKALLVLFLYSSATYAQRESAAIGLIANKAMVVSAKEEASAIGVQILNQGGNAFDAMIATELALAVCYPSAGNIGGGGFMVYRMANGEKGSLDYREKAPSKASKNMFLDKNSNVIEQKSTQTAFAVGVPGTIAGLFEVHDKFGKLPINEILSPVIELAEKGFILTKKEAEKLDHYRQVLKQVNGDKSLYSQVYKANDTIKNSAFARTLKRISDHGRSEFYNGETAEVLVKYIKSKGGILTIEDLSNYDAIWREPISFKYKDLEITSMAPPSSGGVTLGQIFKMIEPYDVQKLGYHSVAAIQVITEAERRAYADRNFFLGDPDFVDNPIEKMLDESYLKERMKSFSFEKASLSSDIRQGDIPYKESTETTHYSIVDQEGNAVSVTTTLNDNFGSKLFIDELGIFLNNEMDDFSIKPGVPNTYGLVGNTANSVGPNKRMLSSMSPTIVERDGRLYMVLGTPGGSTIITSVLQTILNVYEYDMRMQQAVNAPRFHHQWLPDEVVFEPDGFNMETLEILKKRGYKIQEKDNKIIGKVDAILILDDGRLEGGADSRGDDTAKGF